MAAARSGVRSIAGGTFSCGAAEGGGFVVDVELPTAEPTA